MRMRAVLYAVLGLSITVLFAGAAFVAWSDHRQAVEQTNLMAQSAARLLAIQANRTFAEMKYGIDWLERQIDPEQDGLGLNETVRQNGREIADNLPGVVSLVALDATGRLIFSTTSDIALGTDLTHRMYYVAAMENGPEPYVGKTIEAVGSGRRVYTLSRPVRHEGEVAGIVLASAPADLWSEIADPLAIVWGTAISLERIDGQTLVYQRVLRGRPGPPEEWWRGPDAGPNATATVPVGKYGVHATITIPLHAALERWRGRQINTAIGVVLGLISILALGWFGERALRRETAGLRALQQRTLELQARTAELHEALATQRTLTSEISHRVRNSLQMAASLLSMHGSYVKDEHLETQIAKARARISAIAKIHDRLHEAAGHAVVRFDSYVRSLADDIATSTGATCTVSTDILEMPPDRATWLGLIATELAINAAKYGGDDDARIEIETRLEDGNIRLSVRDYGRGLPENFSLEGGGLGMRIVSTLAGQLGGRLTFENAEPGARFTMIAPASGTARDERIAADQPSGRGVAVPQEQESPG